MQRGVSAEAAREGIVAVDGTDGKIVGEPRVLDLTRNIGLRCK